MAVKQHSNSNKSRNYVRTPRENSRSTDSISQNIRDSATPLNSSSGLVKKSPWSAEATKKLRRHVASTKRSDWAAHMNGADLKWLHSRQVKDLAVVFGGKYPAWLIESEPWRTISGDRFKHLRTVQLGLSVEQCATYLRTHRSTISRWESGAVEVSYPAFEALRLLSTSIGHRLSHKEWDGWFINRQTGELICPDNGKLAVKPEEIKGLPGLYNRLSILMLHVEKLEQQVGYLTAENTALRSGDKSRQLAAELEAMQQRIGNMLSDVSTAEVIEFQPMASELRLTA